MGSDSGFDLSPPLQVEELPKWLAFLKEIKNKFVNDPVMKENEHDLEFCEGEHPRLLKNGIYFRRFSSKKLANVENYIMQVYVIAKSHFGTRVIFWDEDDKDDDSVYSWDVVYECDKKAREEKVNKKNESPVANASGNETTVATITTPTTSTYNRCSYCFKPNAPSKCSICKKRWYCDTTCQKLDWKNGGHKKWCNKSGELGFDFEIRPVEGKGMGVYALRTFERGDKIMYERPFLAKTKQDTIFSSYKINQENAPSTLIYTPDDLIQQLHPIGGSFFQKLNTNAVSCVGELTNLEISNGNAMKRNSDLIDSGLFLTLSKFNHDCLGNAFHYYYPKEGVKILVASTRIEIGSEITFSYAGSDNDTFATRKDILFRQYGFVCNCKVCVDDTLQTKLANVFRDDQRMMEVASQGKITPALFIGKKLLKAYDELQMSYNLYSRTYYDLFQTAVTQRKTLEDAKKYIIKAQEYHVMFSGDEDVDYANYIKKPQSHRNYLILG